MNDILKRLLLAWLIHLFWISAAQATCDTSLRTVDIIPERPTEAIPVVINATFKFTKPVPENVSYQLLGQSIRIDVIVICQGLTFTQPPLSFSMDIGKLPKGKYTIDFFYRIKDIISGNISGEIKGLSIPLSVSERVEYSAIPSLSQSGIVLLTLLFFLIVMVHRDNYIDFNKVKDS